MANSANCHQPFPGIKLVSHGWGPTGNTWFRIRKKGSSSYQIRPKSAQVFYKPARPKPALWIRIKNILSFNQSKYVGYIIPPPLPHPSPFIRIGGKHPNGDLGNRWPIQQIVTGLFPELNSFLNARQPAVRIQIQLFGSDPIPYFEKRNRVRSYL